MLTRSGANFTPGENITQDIIYKMVTLVFLAITLVGIFPGLGVGWWGNKERKTGIHTDIYLQMYKTTLLRVTPNWK